MRDAANRNYQCFQLLTLAAMHPADPKKMQAGLLAELRGKKPVSAFRELQTYAQKQKAGPAH